VLEASERPATTQQHGRTVHCVLGRGHTILTSRELIVSPALLSRAEWPNLYSTMFVQRIASFYDQQGWRNNMARDVSSCLS
jgi:hypothetical protein